MNRRHSGDVPPYRPRDDRITERDRPNRSVSASSRPTQQGSNFGGPPPVRRASSPNATRIQVPTSVSEAFTRVTDALVEEVQLRMKTASQEKMVARRQSDFEKQMQKTPDLPSIMDILQAGLLRETKTLKSLQEKAADQQLRVQKALQDLLTFSDAERTNQLERQSREVTKLSAELQKVREENQRISSENKNLHASIIETQKMNKEMLSAQKKLEEKVENLLQASSLHAAQTKLEVKKLRDDQRKAAPEASQLEDLLAWRTVTAERLQGMESDVKLHVIKLGAIENVEATTKDEMQAIKGVVESLTETMEKKSAPEPQTASANPLLTDEMHQTLQTLQEKVERHDEKLSAIGEDEVENIIGNMLGLETKLANLDTQLTSLQSDMATIKASSDGVETERSKEFSGLVNDISNSQTLANQAMEHSKQNEAALERVCTKFGEMIENLQAKTNSIEALNPGTVGASLNKIEGSLVTFRKELTELSHLVESVRILAAGLQRQYQNINSTTFFENFLSYADKMYPEKDMLEVHNLVRRVDSLTQYLFESDAPGSKRRCTADGVREVTNE